mmetsp:Transcript_63666/g.149526  ORF Transcript_63666/g.149526 Transcript_63666/m.149526 type:complete len:122 (-) Transcript_63666:7-372(-)
MRARKALEGDPSKSTMLWFWPTLALHASCRIFAPTWLGTSYDSSFKSGCLKSTLRSKSTQLKTSCPCRLSARKRAVNILDSVRALTLLKEKRSIQPLDLNTFGKFFPGAKSQGMDSMARVS